MPCRRTHDAQIRFEARGHGPPSPAADGSACRCRRHVSSSSLVVSVVVGVLVLVEQVDGRDETRRGSPCASRTLSGCAASNAARASGSSGARRRNSAPCFSARRSSISHTPRRAPTRARSRGCASRDELPALATAHAADGLLLDRGEGLARAGRAGRRRGAGRRQRRRGHGRRGDRAPPRCGSRGRSRPAAAAPRPRRARGGSARSSRARRRGSGPAWHFSSTRVGPVAHRQVRPVVVLPALRGGELLPPLLRVLPLRLEQRPQRGGVDHHAVVEVGRVAGVLLARRALARRSAARRGRRTARRRR